jgi:hypothetical protein
MDSLERPGRTGMLQSGPLDWDLAVWVKGKGGQGSERRRLLAGDHSRGGSSPEMADLGLPGPILDEIRPWRMLAARVTHLGGWHGSAGVATARATAWAARVSGARRRARVPVPRVAYDPRRLALKVQGEDVLLTKGLWWLELRCGVDVDNGRAAEARRRSRTGCNRGGRGLWPA